MDRSELSDQLRQLSLDDGKFDNTLIDTDITKLHAQLHEDTVRNLVAKQYKQHTPEWYTIREKLATASVLADLLYYPNNEKRKQLYQPYIDQFGSLGKPNAKHLYIGYSGHREAWLKRHHVPWNGGGEACHWGTRFEDVAAALYETIYKTKLVEYGLLIHPKYDWIGVSPDGMTLDGRLVEIKNPYMRMKPCALYYWIQCQLQMEVCNTSKPLHFFQCEMQLYANKEDYLADEGIDSIERWKGAFVQLNKTKCIYPTYTQIAFNSEAMVTWCEEECTRQMEKWNALTIEERIEQGTPEAPFAVYWKSTKIKCTVIKRSPEWFAGILSEAELHFQTLMNPTFYPAVEQKEIDELIRRETTPWSYIKPKVRVWSSDKLKRHNDDGEGGREHASACKPMRKLPLGIGFRRN